jgi:phytoene dehydrogenase-like protein
MSASRYDAIVVGGGHNGLITAAYLARAGLGTLVLERRNRVGGAAVTQEFHPGFKVDTAAHRVGALHPAVLSDLELDARRLPFQQADPTVLAPFRDGRYLTLWRDPVRSAETIREISVSDADRWAAFCDFVSRAGRVLQTLYEAPPPRLQGAGAGDLWSLVRLGGRLRGIGRKDLVDVLRVLPMTADEFLSEWFESEELKGALAASAVTGLHQGPMASGTAFMFLHQHVGVERGIIRPTLRVRGGIGQVSGALADAATRSGAEIRVGVEVDGISTEGKRVTGVTTAGGEHIQAQLVVSGLDPRRTFLGLLDPTALDVAFRRKVANLKFRGVCAKVNLALSELPDFTCVGADQSLLAGLITISPSLMYLERAYDAAKYGRVSDAPYLEVIIPSISDDSLAPRGAHVMSILAQYAPYHLAEGSWDDARRKALGDLVVRTLAAHAPNLEETIRHRQVLTPPDLERELGLTEGNIYHGEMTLDQVFFMRPVPGWSSYRSPVQGLYLCSAGTHPGGGVTGNPGHNAAQEILSDR